MTIDEVMRVVFDFGGQVRDADSGGDEAAATVRAAIESYAGAAAREGYQDAARMCCNQADTWSIGTVEAGVLEDIADEIIQSAERKAP